MYIYSLLQYKKKKKKRRVILKICGKNFCGNRIVVANQLHWVVGGGGGFSDF